MRAMNLDAPAKVELATDMLGDALVAAGMIQSISNRMTSTGTMFYAHFGLGFLEARILRDLLLTPPISASRLSVRLSVDPAAISRAVSRLLLRGLLTKSLAPKRTLALTASGERLAQTVAQAFDQRCARLVAELESDDLKRLLQTLEQLQRNLTKVAALSSEMDSVTLRGEKHGRA